MVKVVWTQRALKDLEDIGDFISKDSERYAAHTLSKLIDTAGLIEINPLFGRAVPEFKNKSIREMIKGNYRVIYQIRKSDLIFILTVFHAARHLKKKNLQ